MRLATSPRILQAGRDEKETKLKDFIAAHLPARTTDTVFTLVVRAPDSPAAKAVVAVLARASARRVLPGFRLLSEHPA